MKRKVIKQGHNTLTITLPHKWAEQFNIKPGDDVELNEKEDGIFIKANKKGKRLYAEVDISDVDIPTIWKYFMALYREGYDEIKINFSKNAKYETPYKFMTQHTIDKKYEKKSMLTPFEFLDLIIHRFVGFEIIEQRENYCIVKSMVEVTEKEFDSSLKRVFLLIQQMGEELVRAIDKNNTDYLEHVHDIDINVDKFHDYCIRVLNKTGFQSVQKTYLIFSSLFIMELIGDEFKNISNHILNEKKLIRLENLKGLSHMVVAHLNDYCNLYHEFDKNKIMEMAKKDIDIHLFLPKFYQKKDNRSKLSDSELEIFNHLRRITHYINSLIELRMEMEY